MNVINYYRCSTSKQDYSIENQRLQVFNYLNSLGKPYTVVGEFHEIESGRNNQRPQLLAALKLAKSTKSTVCVSRLDRLSRSALYTLQLIQQSKIPFVFCDAPQMDFVTLGVMAILSEREVSLIRARVREGMRLARERLMAQGRRLGNPRPADSIRKAHISIQRAKAAFNESVLIAIREIQGTGIGNNLQRIADCLNKRGEKGRRGGAWTATAVKRVLASSA
jgi:DNA invertase Pin-like site-specific DNA recombinase